MNGALEPIIQKGGADCAVAALAMTLGKPYREVSEVTVRIVPRVHERGIWMLELRRVAAAFGMKLNRHETWSDELEDETCLMALGKRGAGHLATVFEGVVIDPMDGLLWNRDAFIATRKWTLVHYYTLEHKRP